MAIRLILILISTTKVNNLFLSIFLISIQVDSQYRLANEPLMYKVYVFVGVRLFVNNILIGTTI